MSTGRTAAPSSLLDDHDEHLTPEERELVAAARRFCAGAFSDDLHASYLRGEPFPRDWILRWAEAGFLRLQVEPRHGGHGASFLCKIRVAAEVARHSFAAAFCLNNLQGQATRISRAGSDAQRERLLPGLMAGTVLAAPSMSEPDGGSDLGAVSTVAVPVEDGWSVTGTKTWVTNGTVVDYATMLVRMGDEGAFANLLVPCRDGPTMRREAVAMPGGAHFRLARIELRAHVVPAWGLLDPPGSALRTSMAAVNAARIHVAAMCVGTLHAALCEAVAYAGTRQASGAPILAHQGLQWQLAEVATRLEAASALVLRAARLVDRGRDAMTIAAQCKLFAVDAAIWGVDQCIRSMGAVGASAAHRLGMQLDEVRLAAFADGTNEMMRDRVGRGLARDYAEAPGGGGAA